MESRGCADDSRRFEILKFAIAESLCELGQLLLHNETGHYLEKEDVYHKLVKATAILAHGLKEGTEL